MIVHDVTAPALCRCRASTQCFGTLVDVLVRGESGSCPAEGLLCVPYARRASTPKSYPVRRCASAAPAARPRPITPRVPGSGVPVVRVIWYGRMPSPAPLGDSSKVSVPSAGTRPLPLVLSVASNTSVDPIWQLGLPAIPSEKIDVDCQIDRGRSREAEAGSRGQILESEKVG